MKLRIALLGATAIFFGAAYAGDLDGFTGLLAGGYTYSNVLNYDTNTYDIGGAVNYAIPSTGFNVQGGFNYNELNVASQTADRWTGNGAIYWRGQDGAAGVFGNYNYLRLSHVGGADYGDYGVFGDWYANDKITVHANGGGIAEGGLTGGFFGAGATYYVLPQLSASADVAYNNISNLSFTILSVGGEYLPFEEVPVSLSVSYIYKTMHSGHSSLDTNAVMFRLAYRFGESGSLVQLDRNGPVKLPNQSILPF